jgi:pyrroloquinoline quinone biosynthesis protein D
MTTAAHTATDWRPQIAHGHRLQWEEVQKSWVLLYPEGMVRLNGSAGEIFQRCNGQSSVDTLISELEAKFQIEGLAPEVRQLLSEGARRGWIV